LGRIVESDGVEWTYPVLAELKGRILGWLITSTEANQIARRCQV
jgi:hypothetical protein